MTIQLFPKHSFKESNLVGRNILYRISRVKIYIVDNTINNDKEFGEGENCSIEETSLHWIDV